MARCVQITRGMVVAPCILLFLFIFAGSGRAENAEIAKPVKTVGVILTRDVPFFDKLHNALKAQLARKGYEGRVKFILQRPYSDPIAWSNAARKLISADVDAILTYGAPATLSAVREHTGIPIIYAGVYEPIATGIKSKNATGVYSKFQVSSLLRYLRASIPVKNLGVIYSSMEEDSAYQLSEISAIAGRYGITLTPLNLRRPGDIAGMLADVNINALLMTSSSMASGVLPTIMHIAKGRKIPTASLIRDDESQATITLSSDPERDGIKAAEMLIKILNGAPVHSIPPDSSKEIELVFNLREAKSMGIKVSMDLVTEATRIIY